MGLFKPDQRPERILTNDKNYNATSIDTVTFTSISKPTSREKSKVNEIDLLLKEKLLTPIKAFISDASALVRLKAYEAIMLVDPLKYNDKEKSLLEKAKELAMADIAKYDNGKDIDGFIKDLKKQGFVFYFANDTLPKDLWTDEEFLESWNWDLDDIDEQFDYKEPLVVKDVLKKPRSAEIHYNRKDCKALFLFHDKKPTPESFWHEWFHYCQNKAGLFKRNVNSNENQGSAFAKRELETYQFIIANRKTFKTNANDLKKDLAVWNSYKDLYHYEKASKKERQAIETLSSETLRELTLKEKLFNHINNKFDDVSSIHTIIKSDTEVELIDRENQLLKHLLNKHNMKWENLVV